jgi:putative intracellular protease/amidase
MATTTPGQPLKVLLTLHHALDALDFVGPLEILSHAHFPAAPNSPPTHPAAARHSSPSTKAFLTTVAAVSPLTQSAQGVTFCRDISIASAYDTLSDYDILVIPGGSAPSVLDSGSEPLGLISAFAALPPRHENGADGQHDRRKERVLLSVCTGSLFLARQGVLVGKTAVTHPASMEKLERLCQDAEARAENGVAETKIVDERFVVNAPDENGLRVVTAGGISCGLDATLWLVEHIAGAEARGEVCRITQYAYREGIVVGE